MAKYVLVYKGGGSMGASLKEQRKIMDAWMSWFGSLGDAVVDPGNPFGPSCTIAPGGEVSDGGASGLTGYSVISAESLADATLKAKGCPVLADGGGLHIYEAIPID